MQRQSRDEIIASCPAPPGQCPPLRSVARGWDWSVGASLQVECQPGSRLAGAAMLTCHAPGRWDAATNYTECLQADMEPVFGHGVRNG